MRKISLVMLGAVLGASTVLVGTQSHLFFSGANAAVSDTYKSLNLFGDVFVDHFAATREWEEREFRRAITDWEMQRYFEII